MATATLTITDRPDGGVTIVAESDPAIPMLGNFPDVDALTDAQACAVACAAYIHDSAGQAEWRTLIR